MSKIKKLLKKMESKLLGEKMDKDFYYSGFTSKMMLYSFVGLFLLFAGGITFILPSLRQFSVLLLLCAAFAGFQAFRFYYYRTYGHYVVLEGMITAINIKYGRKKKIKSQKVIFHVEDSEHQQDYMFTTYSNRLNLREGNYINVYVPENCNYYLKDGVCVFSNVIEIETLSSALNEEL